MSNEIDSLKHKLKLKQQDVYFHLLILGFKCKLIGLIIIIRASISLGTSGSNWAKRRWDRAIIIIDRRVVEGKWITVKWNLKYLNYKRARWSISVKFIPRWEEIFFKPNMKLNYVKQEGNWSNIVQLVTSFKSWVKIMKF